ncbi:hypothetical protein RHMOL_Rhmol06G0288100 [Rhododendron molle]|uniref:Uncharacterized protein n=1 Tax=Rhododendron molle TaxID=49168 RepID=A0ACC0NJQ2_RHOML|nr:hypothetical protein RHMOL_Rhmol06G0288100 [Rhododendron molle]
MMRSFKERVQTLVQSQMTFTAETTQAIGNLRSQLTQLIEAVGQSQQEWETFPFPPQVNRREKVGLVNDVEEVDLVLPPSSEFGGDEEFTAREEREEEVDPLVIEVGVEDSLVEPSELGANAELTAQCSPLESNVKVEPPLMYLPLLIRAAYVFLLRSYESRKRGAHCPPYDGPIKKSPTAEEWDAEIDYLQSLMDEQDRKYGFESESPIFGDQDFVEEELVEKPNLEDEVLVEESQSMVVEHIDFLGVDDYDFVYLPSITNYVHCSKINLVPQEHLEALQFLKTTRQKFYSKYLFLWCGRVQFLTLSVEWGNVIMENKAVLAPRLDCRDWKAVMELERKKGCGD